MSEELIKAAKNAHATIAAMYEWVDRVEQAGGTRSLSGIAAAHAMIESMKKNKPRLDRLITEPLLAAIEKEKGK